MPRIPHASNSSNHNKHHLSYTLLCACASSYLNSSSRTDGAQIQHPALLTVPRSKSTEWKLYMLENPSPRATRLDAAMKQTLESGSPSVKNKNLPILLPKCTLESSCYRHRSRGSIRKHLYAIGPMNEIYKLVRMTFQASARTRCSSNQIFSGVPEDVFTPRK